MDPILAAAMSCRPRRRTDALRLSLARGRRPILRVEHHAAYVPVGTDLHLVPLYRSIRTTKEARKMAASSETLRQGRQMSPGAWALLVVVGLLAVALAVGGYAISTRTTAEPAPATTVTESDTVAAAVPQESGLIKNGLQPRPFTMIAVPAPQIEVADTPDGFVRMGTDFRPIPIEQRP